MSITLPPLPAPAITTKHGPWKPSQFHEDETYCEHCLTRSIFALSRQCNPRVDLDALRARDLEVARLVLEAAAQAAQPDDSYQDEWFYAKADAVKCIRALEVKL